ncbi:MAG: hypothetical protein COV00_03070 [Candidatus Tagabacteria bacterium CG10_big_fil_rev_8_21_14_0_10_40_13]|uniref:Uncharacterized protein n=1 Tax=Candidatus Tagabacteria bacterium CG10_big_fil_rev_8_21_14_0_10_40_13 TaxID=1975022 RepID=A0A2M8L8F5_9BACT|nr:MAG: hypothetical protein COV00_03070 [Candidatus Tagabacteria bacterium CG10_big_fil_rev_8_21_14_0_10_40_13]
MFEESREALVFSYNPNGCLFFWPIFPENTKTPAALSRIKTITVINFLFCKYDKKRGVYTVFIIAFFNPDILSF